MSTEHTPRKTFTVTLVVDSCKTCPYQDYSRYEEWDYCDHPDISYTDSSVQNDIFIDNADRLTESCPELKRRARLPKEK